MKPSNTESVHQLLSWLARYQPHVYRGMVRRFTPPENNAVAGLWDSITSISGNVLTSVSNFAQSQGFENLLKAATPFLTNKVEKEQLELQLKRIANGLAPTAPTAPGTPGATPTTLPAPATESEIPWKWILGGTAALGLGYVLLGRRRRA